MLPLKNVPNYFDGDNQLAGLSYFAELPNSAK